MLIREIFDSHIDNLQWQSNGRFLLTSFEIDDRPYTVQIDRKSINIPELKNKKTAEVSYFRRDKEGDKAFTTTNDTDASTVVLGVVSNALMEKFPEFDAFHFIAEKRHSNTIKEYNKKVKIYFFIADKIKRDTGCYLYEGDKPGGREWVVSKIKIEHSTLRDARQDAINSMKKEDIRIFVRSGNTVT